MMSVYNAVLSGGPSTTGLRPRLLHTKISADPPSESLNDIVSVDDEIPEFFVISS